MKGHQPEKVDSRPKVPEGLSSGAKKTFGCDGDRSICTNNGCSNCLKGCEYFSPHKVISYEEMKNLGGIIEFMTINPNVDSFVREKEVRIEKLEKMIDRIQNLAETISGWSKEDKDGPTVQERYLAKEILRIIEEE